MLHLWYLTAHKYAYYAVVHIVNHIVEELSTLQLEDYQRVLLLVACILYRVFQLVKSTEVLLPALVDDVEQYGLFELFYHALTFRVVCLFKVTRDVVNTLAVGDRNHDALISVALILVNLLDNGVTDSLYSVGLTLEGIHSQLERLLSKSVVITFDKLLISERTFHREHLYELFLASLVVVVLDDVYHAVPDDIRNIHSDTFTHKSVTTFLIYYGTLFVHHVVVLEQAFTNTEVVLFDLLLCTFYAS